MTAPAQHPPEQERAREIAEEGLEWCKDFRDGMFTPAPTRDGWTVEMHGLVDSHDELARAYLALASEHQQQLRERVRKIMQDCLDAEKFDAQYENSRLPGDSALSALFNSFEEYLARDA